MQIIVLFIYTYLYTFFMHRKWELDSAKVPRGYIYNIDAAGTVKAFNSIGSSSSPLTIRRIANEKYKRPSKIYAVAAATAAVGIVQM
jgi:hypothetical protein